MYAEFTNQPEGLSESNKFGSLGRDGPSSRRDARNSGSQLIADGSAVLLLIATA